MLQGDGHRGPFSLLPGKEGASVIPGALQDWEAARLRSKIYFPQPVCGKVRASFASSYGVTSGQRCETHRPHSRTYSARVLAGTQQATRRWLLGENRVPDECWQESFKSIILQIICPVLSHKTMRKAL